MKRIISIVGLFMCVFQVQPAYAAEAWTDYVTISKLYPKPNGLEIFISSNVNPGGACEANRMMLRGTLDNFEMMSAALLTAFAMNAQVNFNYDTSTVGECSLSINRMMIKQA